MEKSIKKNYIYNLLYQLLAIILPIITTPYVARKLGAEGNGIYGYTISIVTYFILVGSLGLSIYGSREIAYYQKDSKKVSSIFWELIIIKAITMTISALTFYFLFCTTGDYSIYYKILLIELLANAIDITWFYQGLEDFKRITIRNFVIKIISVISIFIFIKGPNDVSKYLLIYSLSTLLGSSTLWIGIGKYIHKTKDLKILHHIPGLFVLFLPQIAVQVYTVLDKTMIGSILNDMSEVGFYEQSQKIIKILLTLITSISLVMMPRIANSHKEGDNEKIKKYMNGTFNFIFLLALPFMLGVFATSNNFVPLFFGKGYDKVITLLKITSIIIPLISLSSVIGTQYLLAIKKQKEFTISVIIGAFINFIFNYLLIYNFKSIGASIATVIAEASVTFVQLFFIRKEFSLFKIIYRAKNYFISSLIMFIICELINYIHLNNKLLIIIQFIIGVIVYFTLLIILKDDSIIEVKNKISNKVAKIKKKSN